MKYRIDTQYGWYNNKSLLVIFYFINGVPFTFDDLPTEAYGDAEVLKNAEHQIWEPEEMYRASMYLMDEECHPMMFELELENPELLPTD